MTTPRHTLTLFIALAVLLAASAAPRKGRGKRLPIVDIREQVDYGHDSVAGDPRPVDIVVVHSNYHVGNDMWDTQGCLDQFRQYDVAPHYMITRDNKILYMVDENVAAWHAGKSVLPGTDRDSINYTSIGIELVSHPLYPPTPQQTALLVRLVCDIHKRHPIRYLMRHSDIAPKRKTDPWNFPWQEFVKRVELRSGPVTTAP